MKNIPLTLFEKVVCERELETEQNCNILTPTLPAIIAFLSCSPGLLNRGPGGPASLGHGPHSRIFSPTATAQSGPEAPLCWVLVLSTASYLQLPEFPVVRNNLMPTLLPASVTISHSIQPLDSQGHILIFLDRMHLLFTQVHFLFWQLGQVGGQYTTQTGCDTRSIFKWRTAGLNAEFSFSLTSYQG